MAKGYWIAAVDVSDPEAYKAYIAANAIAFRKYGARFLVRGGAAEVMEGQSRSRRVVIEFADYATGAGLLSVAGIRRGDRASEKMSRPPTWW